jgi:hypothetical protein
MPLGTSAIEPDILGYAKERFLIFSAGDEPPTFA